MKSKPDLSTLVFGMVVKKYRTRLKMRQTDLANYAGVTSAVICKLEKGKTNPGLQTLLKIAGGLCLQPSELMRHYEETYERVTKDTRNHKGVKGAALEKLIEFLVLSYDEG